MRILYFSRDYTTHDRRFLLKLAASGHDTWYLRLEDDGIPYEQRPLPAAVHQVSWPPGRNHQGARAPGELLREIPALERIVQEIRPDAIQAGPIQSCGFLVALLGFHPFLAMSWGSDVLVDADRDEAWRWVTRYTLDRSDLLICDSSAVVEKVRQLCPYPDDRIVRFPWGIDLRAFAAASRAPSFRRPAGWEDCFVVLSTRTWEPLYGIDVVLKAFCQAHGSNPRLRLLLLGTGSLARAVGELIAVRHLEDVVCRPGQIPNLLMSEVFGAADLYVSCASSDGTSISLLEALAAGLPVVVTDIPGNREWVVPDQNGWLAPAGDAVAFGQAILRASRLSRAEREEIGRNNQQLARERANWDHNSSTLLAAYERLKENGRDH